MRIPERLYKYTLALEFPKGFKELRVADEQLVVAGVPVYSRSLAQVTVPGGSGRDEAKFLVDWHLVALSVIQDRSDTDDLSIFKTWLAQTVILAPIPALMSGDSTGATLEPVADCTNFGEWLSGLLGRYPAAYSPDRNVSAGGHAPFRRHPTGPVGSRHQAHDGVVPTRPGQYADRIQGTVQRREVLLLTAEVLAANKSYGPLFCFWDEPDNYLSLSEVGQFVMYLRRAFGSGGQLLATSHNPEAIRKFSDENTFLLSRNSRLEPTQVRRLDQLSVAGDLVEALIRGDDIHDQ